jgi:hypothetical protein
MGMLAYDKLEAQECNAIRLSGRIEKVRKGPDGNQEAMVTLPASTQYDRPQTICVRSNSRLGNRGDEIDVIAAPAGYVREFNYVDKKTGEQGTGWESRAWFQVLDH